MLVDELDITLTAGHGGPGKVSFVPTRSQKGGPDGGNGGRGGDIYITVTSDLSALNRYANKKSLEASDGEAGGGKISSGKNGEDLEVIFPIGTELTDTRTGNVIVLDSLEQRIKICKGGYGGRGNFEFRSSTNTTPLHAQPGLKGEQRHFRVLLKMIADFGLIGLPNAGKSSLLNELTNANAKIGDYAFTTLEPNLGVIHRKVIADIPGLIEGASEGKGLGVKFLKHIEKVRLLLHCVSAESEDVVADYQIVMDEMAKFNPEIVQKEQIILLTKIDTVTPEEVKAKSKALSKFKHKVLPVSVFDSESLEQLRQHLI